MWGGGQRKSKKTHTLPLCRLALLGYSSDTAKNLSSQLLFSPQTPSFLLFASTGILCPRQVFPWSFNVFEECPQHISFSSPREFQCEYNKAKCPASVLQAASRQVKTDNYNFFEICSARSGASSTAGNWAAVFKPAGESGSSVVQDK